MVRAYLWKLLFYSEFQKSATEKSNRGLTLYFQLLLVAEGSISYLCCHEEDALAHCGLKMGSSFFLNSPSRPWLQALSVIDSLDSRKCSSRLELFQVTCTYGSIWLFLDTSPTGEICSRVVSNSDEVTKPVYALAGEKVLL